MPAPLEPPALDALVDVAERSRVGDWSLRSALCRYAQPDPPRVAAVLSLVRRWEAGLHDHVPTLRKDGARLLAAAESSGDPAADDALVVGLLRVGMRLDETGDRVAAWADDRTGPSPAADLDAAAAEIAAELDRLGVPEEEPIPRGMRGRG